MYSQFWDKKDQMGAEERKLAEAIFELISTELDYEADLATMQKVTLNLSLSLSPFLIFTL